MTRDNVTIKVNAVIFFRVIDPRLAILEVAQFLYATSQLAQTTLRSVLGEIDLDELLGAREKLNVRLQSILDGHTAPWGSKVTVVEVKQVDLAEQMIRAIARQAEAERERRAKVIHAEGEIHCCQETGDGGRGAATAARRHSVAVFADACRNRHGKEHNHRVPAANRPDYLVRAGAEWRRQTIVPAIAA